MSKFYRPRRIRNLYEPGSRFVISRSKLETFINCPRCFYNDRRRGIDRPPGYPFTLNSAVDHLLKKEFDQYRASQTAHPIMVDHGLEAVPFSHPLLDKWRDALHGGVRFYHAETNLEIMGAIDDLWVNPNGELILVDYKATSRSDFDHIDSSLHSVYERQLQIYAWLFSQNGFRVTPTGYLLYCNGKKDSPRFDQALLFDMRLIACQTESTWVEALILAAHECLNRSTPPLASTECDFCAYALELNKTDIAAL